MGKKKFQKKDSTIYSTKNKKVDTPKFPSGETEYNELNQPVLDPNAYAKNLLQMMDPTGITSWPDIYKAKTDEERALAYLSAIPSLGKFAKKAGIIPVWQKGADIKSADNYTTEVGLPGNANQFQAYIKKENTKQPWLPEFGPGGKVEPRVYTDQNLFNKAKAEYDDALGTKEASDQWDKKFSELEYKYKLTGDKSIKLDESTFKQFKADETQLQEEYSDLINWKFMKQVSPSKSNALFSLEHPDNNGETIVDDYYENTIVQIPTQPAYTPMDRINPFTSNVNMKGQKVDVAQLMKAQPTLYQDNTNHGWKIIDGMWTRPNAATRDYDPAAMNYGTPKPQALVSKANGGINVNPDLMNYITPSAMSIQDELQSNKQPWLQGMNSGLHTLYGLSNYFLDKQKANSVNDLNQDLYRQNATGQYTQSPYANLMNFEDGGLTNDMSVFDAAGMEDPFSMNINDTQEAEGDPIKDFYNSLKEQRPVDADATRTQQVLLDYRAFNEDDATQTQPLTADITDTFNTYVRHQQGNAGFKKLMSGNIDKELVDNMNNNLPDNLKSNDPKTVANNYINHWSRKVSEPLSANFKQSDREAIVRAATEAGENPTKWLKIAEIESGGGNNLHRKDSKYHGYFQIDASYVRDQKDLYDPYKATKAAIALSKNQWDNSKKLKYEYGGLQSLFTKEITPNAEVEGKENILTPDGLNLRIEGPSHKQGGIDINLPQNSFVFSKKLKAPKDIIKGVLDKEKLSKDEKKMSFADLSNEFNTEKDKENEKSEDKFKAKTAQVNLMNKNTILGDLKIFQEAFKAKKGMKNDLESLMPKMAGGGPFQPLTPEQATPWMPQYYKPNELQDTPPEMIKSTGEVYDIQNEAWLQPEMDALTDRSTTDYKAPEAKTTDESPWKTLDLNKINNANTVGMLANMIGAFPKVNYPVMQSLPPAPNMLRGIDLQGVMNSQFNSNISTAISQLNNSNLSDVQKQALINQTINEGLKSINLADVTQQNMNIANTNTQMQNAYQNASYTQGLSNMDKYRKESDMINAGKAKLRNESLEALSKFSKSNAETQSYLPMQLEMSGQETYVDENGNIKYRYNQTNNKMMDAYMRYQALVNQAYQRQASQIPTTK